MTTTRIRNATTLLTCALCAATSWTCTPTQAPLDTLTQDDLTTAELRAIDAALQVPGALTQATDVAQNATADAGETAAAQALSEVSFGTCPTVTLSAAAGSPTELTIDFGSEPCTVTTYDGEATVTCSGSATGTFDPIARHIGLQFDALQCDEKTLDGSADLTYTLMMPGAELEGEWDLAWSEGEEYGSAVGSGLAVHTPEEGACCDTTSVPAFTGTVTKGEDEWSVVLDGIEISFEQYLSKVPYAGSVTVDGPAIRAITVLFGEPSPTDGTVTVTIENGPSFTTDLASIEAWLNLLSGA